MFNPHEQKCEVRGYTLLRNVRDRSLTSAIKRGHPDKIQFWKFLQPTGVHGAGHLPALGTT